MKTVSFEYPEQTAGLMLANYWAMKLNVNKLSRQNKIISQNIIKEYFMLSKKKYQDIIYIKINNLNCYYC